jgi:hypothetical protein
MTMDERTPVLVGAAHFAWRRGREADGRRFVANTPRDDATLREMEATEQVGRRGQVCLADDGRRNFFIPG